MIELKNGWDGTVIKDQAAFDTNDGMPMVIAAWVSGILHIGLLTPKMNSSVLTRGKSGGTDGATEADFKDEVA